MQRRFDYAQIPTPLRDHSVRLARAIDELGLDKRLVELVKLRVSELNGCAYCLHMHSEDALKLGESPVRLRVLSAHHESTLFTASERAALALAERLTREPSAGVGDALPAELAAHFTEREILALTQQVAMINYWNRCAIGLGYVHPSEASAAG
jgi:uncharacterized peroxidase-related enzyme